MNKKLETVMGIAAKKNAHDRNKNESVDDRITSFDRYEFGFLDGFQKGVELMHCPENLKTNPKVLQLINAVEYYLRHNHVLDSRSTKPGENALAPFEKGEK